MSITLLKTSQILNFTEEVQDAAAAMLTAGSHSGISVNYVDASNRIDLTSTGDMSGAIAKVPSTLDYNRIDPTGSTTQGLEIFMPGTTTAKIFACYDKNGDESFVIPHAGSMETTRQFTLWPYGTSTGNTGSILLKELTANGNSAVKLAAPDALAGDYTFTLPDANGTTSHVLTKTATGTEWAAPAAATAYRPTLAWVQDVAGTDTTGSGDAAITGAINGSNKVFTLANTPVGEVSVYINGQMLLYGASNDFTLSGAAVTLSAGQPAPGNDCTVSIVYSKT